MRFRQLVALSTVFFLTTAQVSPADAVFWQAFDLEQGAKEPRTSRARSDSTSRARD